MIGEVLPLVRELAPGVLRGARASLIAVRTTYPKVLVFDGNESRPACVVEVGESDRLVRRHQVLERLYPRARDLVPRSICCAERGGRCVHIQAGLPGTPWFRVADGLDSRTEWRRLLRRALEALQALHRATGNIPAWRGRISLGCALAEQLRLCRSHTKLAPAVVDAVEQWSRDLQLTIVTGVWQHGDFSLNNLLLGPDTLAVIDFDDFGRTSVPLHDAFGLALSFPLSQPQHCSLAFLECLDAALASAAGEAPDPELLKPLLMHHLLWRIDGCAAPSREGLRLMLVELATGLALSPHDWRQAIADVIQHATRKHRRAA